MNIGRRSLRASALTAAAALSLAACSGGAEKPAGEPAPPLAVSVAPVRMSDLAETFEAGGVVQARTTATLTARILAPVRDVRVAPGDRVKAGQVLVVLDATDLGANARSAQAAAAAADRDAVAAASDQQAADAALVLARSAHARIAGLHAKRSATTQELDDATAALRSAEARAAAAAARAQGGLSGVDSARAAAEAAGATASFARIVAPFSGIVTEKLIEPGNMAAPGTPLLRVEDLRGFRLEVRLDESRAGQVAPGSKVAVTLESGVGRATADVEGTVAEVSRAFDADARAFLVKIDLPAVHGLRSGAFGRAHFKGQARRALTVPPDAVIRRGQMTSVFVVENGVARVRLVDVAGSEVLAGLSEGDSVILKAPAALTDGRRVTVGGR